MHGVLVDRKKVLSYAKTRNSSKDYSNMLAYLPDDVSDKFNSLGSVSFSLRWLLSLGEFGDFVAFVKADGHLHLGSHPDWFRDLIQIIFRFYRAIGIEQKLFVQILRSKLIWGNDSNKSNMRFLRILSLSRLI